MNNFKTFGPQHKLVHSLIANSKLKGIDGSDMAIALMVKGFALLFDLDEERAFLLLQSCQAYANDLILRETEALIEANGGDPSAYRAGAEKIRASLNIKQHLDNPPLLDFMRRVKGIPNNLGKSHQTKTAALNLDLSPA